MELCQGLQDDNYDINGTQINPAFHRCRTTKKMIECPNGDPVDMDKYPGYIEYNGCKIKDW